MTKMYYERCPACGIPINGGNEKLEKHLYGIDEPECRWRLKYDFARTYRKRKWKEPTTIVTREIPRQVSPKHVEKVKKPKGKVISSKDALEKTIKEIEEGK